MPKSEDTPAEGASTDVYPAGVTEEDVLRSWLRTGWDFQDALLILTGLHPHLTEWDALPWVAIQEKRPWQLVAAAGFPSAAMIDDEQELKRMSQRILMNCAPVMDAVAGDWSAEKAAKDWLLFAEEKLIDVPWIGRARQYPRLAHLLPPLPAGSSLPGYLNPDHPMFPRELCAAVEAWEAVTRDGDPWERGKAGIAALKDWLRTNKERLGLSDTATERIAEVANWRKTGGAPKTPTRGSQTHRPGKAAR